MYISLKNICLCICLTFENLNSFCLITSSWITWIYSGFWGSQFSDIWELGGWSVGSFHLHHLKIKIKNRKKPKPKQKKTEPKKNRKKNEPNRTEPKFRFGFCFGKKPNRFEPNPPLIEVLFWNKTVLKVWKWKLEQAT